MLTARTIKNQHSNIFAFLHGNLEIAASHCDVPDQATPQSLVFVSDSALLAQARLLKPAILIVQAKMAGELDLVADGASCCFSVKNVSMGMAILLKYFDTQVQSIQTVGRAPSHRHRAWRRNSWHRRFFGTLLRGRGGG